MTLEQANYLGSGDRIEVLPQGLERHCIQSGENVGDYVSQFDSPKIGRLVVVRLSGGETYGFRLDEVELRGPRDAC